jgi:hypothetical protein
MRSLWQRPGTSHQSRIHPALTSFADECHRMLAHLIAYVGALALLASGSIHLWDHLLSDELPSIVEQSTAAWRATGRSNPACAGSALDFPDKTGSYEVFRRSSGGGKDMIRWAAGVGKHRAVGLEAPAEPKRINCTAAPAVATSADWLISAANPSLRGAL